MLRLAAAALALTALGCNLVAGLEEHRPMGAGGAAGAGGASSAGGAGCLSTRDLLVRYHIDEAASGQLDTPVLDAGPTPALDLGIDHASSGQPEFTEPADNRGLRWDVAGADGVVRTVAGIGGSKIMDLHGLDEATMELVIEVTGVDVNGSRLLHVGAESQAGQFTLSSYSTGFYEFFFRNVPLNETQITAAAAWDIGNALATRSVVHLVFDSTQPAADARARLYVDGVVQPQDSGAQVDAPDSGEPLVVAESISGISTYFTLGNRFDEFSATEPAARAFQGILYYAAIYTTALTDDELQLNVDALQQRDDGNACP